MGLSNMLFFKLFLLSLLLASAIASVEFYKLSLQWGRSTCSDGRTRCPTPLPPSIDQKFTIHGLWPQDANDNPVDPYNSGHPCVPQPPTPLTEPLLNQLRPHLDNEWPNLKNLVPKGNMKFWTDEWDKHGTCSDFAHNPVKYFDSARQIRKSLPDFGITPGDKRKVKEVIKLVKGFTDPLGQGGLWPQDANDSPVDPYNSGHPCVPQPPTPLTEIRKSLPDFGIRPGHKRKLKEVIKLVKGFTDPQRQGGLWPQDANYSPVDPYNSGHPCVPQPPTPLTEPLLNQLRPDLDNEWPNLKNLVPKGNMKFWTDEWNKHETCSNFAHNPVKYLDFARQIRKSLPDFGIRPGDKRKVKEVIKLVKGFTGAEPEIACNDANDSPVEPYNSGHPFVPQPPTPVTKPLLNQLRPDLDNEWPNLKNLVPKGNMKLWTDEWNKHGTCSDFAHNPVKYFDSARQIRKSLPDFGIRPGEKRKVKEVIKLVKGFTDPQGQGGLWPQDANDSPVDPYNSGHPCVPLPPTPLTEIRRSLPDFGIRPGDKRKVKEVIKLVKEFTDPQGQGGLWQQDANDSPVDPYNSGHPCVPQPPTPLTEIRKSLPDFGIRPGDKRKVKEVMKLVKGFTDPQGQGGLWPQDANDSPVDLYNSGHPCVPQPPTPLTEPLLNQLRPDLDNEWPNLKNLDPKGNMKFWTDEWNKHGTCSDFAHNRVKYFDSARQIRKSLPDFGIRPGDKSKVKEVIKLVKGFTDPQGQGGLWSHANDSPVDPYNSSHPCVPQPPTLLTEPQGQVGLWPQDANDSPVDPYNSGHPGVPQPPTPLTEIRKSLPDFGIRPGDKRKVKEVIKLVKGFTDPQGQGGLWPQDANDSPVDPYNFGHPCVPQPPTPLTEPLLNQLRPDLDNEWPNLKNLVPKGNMKFWTDEWNKHGTCSDFAHNLVKYFDSAWQIRKSLPDFGNRPGDKRKVKEVIKLVKGFTDPQGQGGLWPQDANDSPIDPYNSGHPSVPQTPTPLTEPLLNQLRPDLDNEWPNLKNLVMISLKGKEDSGRRMQMTAPSTPITPVIHVFHSLPPR
ncbi:hypothetical protein GQ457_03G024370 [Hibiscus cannabinus]